MRIQILRMALGLCALLLACQAPLQAAEEKAQEEAEALAFEDRPLSEELVYPHWFKLSFLDLGEDLADVREAGKRGLIVYLGQKFCPYCKQLLEVNWGKSDILTYTQNHFDVVGLNIWGDRDLIDLSGTELTEKEFAELEDLIFTPSLLFYDLEGEEVLRLRGYYPPYKFRAALEYVADAHYKEESFREFLERADPPPRFELDELNAEEFFLAPPYNLDRSRLPGERPLLVFFEQGDCHACDVLHSGPLKNMVILGQLDYLDSVQLNIWADTPVVTPGGRRTTARDWAEELGLFYTPTLIFFDKHGQEILRVDSVAHFYRLRGVLDYILSGAHEQGISLQRWRRGPLPGGPRAR